jgi:ParB family chromosome partitioning protein
MASNTTDAFEVGTLVQVAPSSVLLERNIREATPDADLIKSVKDLGVLVPLVAVTTQDGRLLIRQGHRRTLAAIEANTKTIPVYVAGSDTETSDAEVARIIAQRDENTHRAGLSTAEEVGVVEQLAAFGLSPAQITKKARIKRAHVDTALAVSGSQLARKATERYDALTLAQAAVVADFEDDAETVTALIAATQTGQFDHVAQRARDERDRANAIREAKETLETTGVTVVERPNYDAKTKRLDSLISVENGEPIDPETHAECPGHVAWLAQEWAWVDGEGNPIPDDADEDDAQDEDEADPYANARQTTIWTPVYGCADPAANGHKDRYSHGSAAPKQKAEDMTEAEREAAKNARKLVIENNKAWDSAEAVRREFLATFAKSKTPPKGTGRFLATEMCHGDGVTSVGGNSLAADWLGKNHAGYGWTDLSPAKTATENRALVLALVQVLAAREAAMTKESWRRDGTHNDTGRYLRFLQSAGYTLSEVEQYAISSKTA